VCEAAGIARDRIALDPGFGFGKTQAHNLALLARLDEIVALGYPLLAGLSRKSTLGAITGRPRASASRRAWRRRCSRSSAARRSCASRRARDGRRAEDPRRRRERGRKGQAMIRKLASGGYRLYSRKVDPKTGKRRNLGTFRTRAAAEKHEREVQFFKRR
jgi:hypothetical protein